ncbi:MAG: HipA domain-containing protein, partial [Demequina sp.]|nr:HipA domain-containing protein [Demequina sp.]
MKTGERLLVFLSGEHVADVSRARTGAVSLEYTSTGRAAGATPLSLALPVSPARYTDRRVTHFLDGLLPEHPGTRAAMARHFQIGTTDAFSLLHGAGLDCAGAVQFCTEDAADAIRRGGSLEPESDSDIEVRLAEMEMDDAVSWVKRHERWSLAGMQPKLALREEDGRWFTATGSEATTHILKPGVRGIAAQALDEHITLAAATRIGLDCAESRWLEFKSQSAVVSTRYDRARHDGTVRRLHQEDLHQAIGMGRNKYDVDDSKEGVTSTDVLAVLRGYSISRDDEDASVRAFVDSLIFSALTASTDGHAKNYSLLLERERVRLAPLYDMASDLPYDTG